MSYRRLISLPHARRLVASAFIGRLPMGMATLALVLFVAAKTGSYVHAGWAVGAYALASGIGTPIQGRLVDRLGPARILTTVVWFETAGWVTVFITGTEHGPLALLLGGCLVAGAARPALSPVVRMLWPRLTGGDRALTDTAMTFEGILVEVFFTLGPLLTAVIVAVGSPGAAVLFAAGASLLGTLAFAAAPTPAAPATGAEERGHERHVESLLRSPTTIVLIASMLLLGAVFGTYEVGVPAFAADHGDSAISGIALAVNSLASMAGGLVYGARRWGVPLERRYRWLSVLFALCAAPLILSGTIPELVVLMGIAGVGIAPLVTTVYMLIEATAPRHTLAEAYGWAVSGITAGTAGGAALSGALTHASGPRAPFVFGLGCAGALVLLAAVASRVIARHPRRVAVDGSSA